MNLGGSPKLIKFVLLVQIGVVLLMVAGGAFWFHFAYSAWPWIVPPDHSEDLVSDHSNIAGRGMLMIIVSLVVGSVSFLIPLLPSVALGAYLVSLLWLIYYRITFTARGFPSLEAHGRPVTNAYLVLTCLLIGVSAYCSIRIRRLAGQRTIHR